MGVAARNAPLRIDFLPSTREKRQWIPKHAGIVDFEKCCEKLDKVRQTPGILSESIGSAFSYAARAWKD
jgi:hypothetical protein